MGKAAPLSLIVAIATAAAAFAAGPVVAVADFAVSSERPELKYVGKGLAEMVAMDLSRGVTVIDRARREELLAELEFSLSGLAAPGAVQEAGRLLSAEYLVFGEIVDMGGQVLVMCSMVRVETGEVAWRGRSVGALADYDSLSRSLAASALKGLGPAALRAAEGMERAAKAPAGKIEAIVAFSKAVDSVDRRDEAEAKAQIKLARAADPRNAAVAGLYARLIAGNPRFQVELDRYAPTHDPAELGFLERGSLYTWANTPVFMNGRLLPFAGSIQYNETVTGVRAGLRLPIGRRAGLSGEVTLSSSDYVAVDNLGANLLAGRAGNMVEQAKTAAGASIGFGYRVSELLAVGISGRAEYFAGRQYAPGRLWIEDLVPGTLGPSFGASLGLAARSPDGRLRGDFQVVWSDERVPAIVQPGPATGTIVVGTVPLIAAATLTGLFLDGSLLASLRLVGDYARSPLEETVVRCVPSLEWWPLRWISARAAMDVAGLWSGGASGHGLGWMAGLGIVLGDLELDLNYIERFRPYRLFPGLGNPNDRSVLVGVTWDGLGQRR